MILHYLLVEGSVWAAQSAFHRVLAVMDDARHDGQDGLLTFKQVTYLNSVVMPDEVESSSEEDEDEDEDEGEDEGDDGESSGAGDEIES
jgi:hypothetical protein